MRSYRKRFAVALSCAVGVALSADPGVFALPKFDAPSIPTDVQGVVIDCPDFLVPTVEVTPAPFVIGYPIVGFHVKIDASLTKFHGRPNLPCGFPDYVAPITDFEWALESRPEGSAAELKNTTSLDPLLPLDRAGTYFVRLTVCPDGCTVQPPGNHLAAVGVPRQDFFVPVQALESAPLGPETMPAVVSSESTGLTPPPGTCSFGAGWLSKQWRAVTQINGPGDYRLIEGSVVKSRVSRKDDPLNHSSQDVNFYVEPDPEYSYLRFVDPDLPVPRPLEIEWERNSFPERYRPTPGDRASVFGYWVTDCGHNHPEIHPPVGIAVHRPRPIRIPDSRTFSELGGQRAGDGIWVPGIITDMFFNTSGGLLMDCDTDSGLANANPIIGPDGSPAPACAPAPSLRHVFRFNIYLPRDPRVTMQQAGFSVPPVPLYVQRDAVSGGPEPIIDTVQDPSGITYLEVTLDLTGYEDSAYAYRIAAGWVLPAADNWGLARWKLRLRQLEVSDDGDGAGRGDGDWRLWLNTNNASNVGFPPQEWTKIVDRDVHGLEDFGGRPWETDAPTADRTLGPDLLRYPPPASLLLPGPRDYGILFHTTGYESDNLADDDAGTVLWSRVTPGALHSWPNQCVSQNNGLGVYSGCVRYHAVFEAVPGSALPPPVLTPAAQGLAGQYVLRCGRFVPGGDDVGVCGGAVADEVLAAPVEGFAVDPLEEPLSLRAGVREFTDFLPFRPGGRESTMLTDITIEDFHRDVLRTRTIDPALVSRGLADLRAVFDEKVADPILGDEAIMDAQVLRLSLPSDLWTEHFASLQRMHSDPDATRAKFTGSGSLESPEGRIRLRSLHLHCSELRTPNSLSLTWGENRFDLDLVMRSACTTEEPETGGKIRTQTGFGFGRYNGAPGAAIEWTLVDHGEGDADDSATIKIRRAGDASILLTSSGAIKRGNLQASRNEQP